MIECPKCGEEFEAEGKIARCPECRASFKNEVAPPKKKVKEASKKPKSAADPRDDVKAGKAPKAAAPVDDDAYGMSEDEDLAETRLKREEAEEKAKEEKKKTAKPVIEIKRKNIGDLEIWEKLDGSMAWFLYGIILWGVIHLFQGLILFFGMIQGAEYAGPVVKFLIRQDQPAFELGRGDVLDRVSFTLAMLGGSDFINATYVLTLLIQVLTYAQIGLWIVGYATALQGVELVESGKGQLISLFTLSGSNFLFAFFLIFLPLVGAYSYVLMPLWGTEMAMCYFNQDRSTPLHIFWSYAPFWEELLTLIVLVCRYGEPIMMAYFVWTVAAALKDEPLEKMAQGTFQMGLAILFLLIAFNLFSLTGNSPVLVRVLRILYLMWYVFMIGWILRMVGMVAKCRETFSFYFNPDAD